MFDLILKALVGYIEKNPAVLEKLIESLVEALIARLNPAK